MKTTIDFPDELLHRAKIVAAERRTTLRNLMVQALRHVTESASEQEETNRKATFKRLLRQMKATNSEPMKPLSRDELHER